MYMVTIPRYFTNWPDLLLVMRVGEGCWWGKGKKERKKNIDFILLLLYFDL